LLEADVLEPSTKPELESGEVVQLAEVDPAPTAEALDVLLEAALLASFARLETLEALEADEPLEQPRLVVVGVPIPDEV